MTTLYWITEYAKVLLGYSFVMFVWPAVVFQKILKGKNITFFFSFCVTVQIVLINSVVLVLGLFHILNEWVVRALFYGVFLWSLRRNFESSSEGLVVLKRFVTGTYGRKHFLFRIVSWIRGKIWWCSKLIQRITLGHRREYGVLAILVVYGMIYFSYGAFQDYSYGFGDLYPHNAWIYGLTNGQIFSAGVYPEAMHCFVYGLHTLFGIRIYSCLLFVAGIHSAVFLLSAYILMKELMHWRYSPMIALAMFLTIDLLCIDEVYSMSRLQWTLPQEFGLFTQFLCAAFLVRYLRLGTQKERKGKLTKCYWDSSLVVFALALAASLAIHFYTTIMAFFLCVAVVPFFFAKIFSGKRFWPLVAAVICGFMIAVLPMAGALASGIPFQGSIGWAMNVINGTDEETNKVNEANAQKLAEVMEEELAAEPEVTSQPRTEDEQNTDIVQNSSNTEGVVMSQPQSKGIVEKIVGLPGMVWTVLQKKAKIVYYAGYLTLYKQERAFWIIGSSFLAVFLWIAYRITVMSKKYIGKKKELLTNSFDGYMVLVTASLIYMIMYCASSLGLPALIAGSRLCSTEQMLILAMLVIPLDVLFWALCKKVSQTILHGVSIACVAGVYLGTQLTGTFHGYLYYELTRHNGAVKTTYAITEEFPKDSYTIISPTDELYQVIQFGRHEELVNLVNKDGEPGYRIPTEYVFIFIEKKPIEYGQSHFFSGPAWLAGEKYPAYYDSYISQCPDITTSEIGPVKEEDAMMRYASHARVYTTLGTRTRIEERAYAWCQEFDKVYPNEMKVYYEDDAFVCYYFKQNPQNPFLLGICEKDAVQ